MPEWIRAPRLRLGDVIGVASPSWFGGEAFVPRAMAGIATLEGLGFRVRVADHALNSAGHVSDTAANRVSDLHALFADPEVRAVIATIGGDHACQLLPLVDWELIRTNPKVFMGFSDISVLTNAIWTMTGLVTFNGPALLTDWAEFPAMPAFSREQALNATTRATPMGDLAPADGWTEEFLDWGTGADRERARTYRPSDGWHWLQPGRGEGHLVGGCLESLQHLRGTPYWPDCRGAVLFLETSELRPSPEDVDGMLMDYENMGVFAALSGLVVARPYGYAREDVARFEAIVAERTAGFGFPVLANVDCGHTTPLQTLPIGVRAVLDADRGRFAGMEAAVR